MTLDLCAAKIAKSGNLVNLEECNCEAAVVNGISSSLGLWSREDLEDVSQGNYITKMIWYVTFIRLSILLTL